MSESKNHLDSFSEIQRSRVRNRDSIGQEKEISKQLSPKQGFIWTGKGISKRLSPKQWTFGQFGRIPKQWSLNHKLYGKSLIMKSKRTALMKRAVLFLVLFKFCRVSVKSFFSNFNGISWASFKCIHHIID